MTITVQLVSIKARLRKKVFGKFSLPPRRFRSNEKFFFGLQKGNQKVCFFINCWAAKVESTVISLITNLRLYYCAHAHTRTRIESLAKLRKLIMQRLARRQLPLPKIYQRPVLIEFLSAIQWIVKTGHYQFFYPKLWAYTSGKFRVMQMVLESTLSRHAR